MIETQAKTLVNLLDKRDQYRRENENLIVFSHREQELARYELKLQALIIQFRVLREREVLHAVALPEGPHIVQLLTELKQTFTEKPEELIQQNALDRLKRSLESYLKKLQDRLRDSWKRFGQQQLPVLPDNVLLVLGRIPAFDSRVSMIRTNFRQMIEQLETLPQRVEDIDKFMQLRQTIDQLWSELDTGDLPEEVLKFLQQSSSTQGVALTALTPVVLGWLTQQGLLSSFRIRAQ